MGKPEDEGEAFNAEVERALKRELKSIATLEKAEDRHRLLLAAMKWVAIKGRIGSPGDAAGFADLDEE